VYCDFFNLRERPFDLTPNPRYLLLTATHREALANLEYGMSAGKGLTLLTGEAGTGKTTLVRRALAARAGAEGRQYVYLNNPTFTRREFYEFLTAQFGLAPELADSKARFLAALEQDLRQRHAGRTTPVLVIDEAQSLPDELLEEIRLLANIETDTDKLLPLVLAGQPELALRLNQSGLRQLKQRVALRCQVVPLTLAETAAYIAGRIRLAGGDAPSLMSRDAVVSVFEHARGIPRTISVICDNALMAAFAAGERPITTQIVRAVARDFDFTRVPVQSAPTSPAPAAATAPRARRSMFAMWPRLGARVTLRHQELS
jgi:type II secretory pathway predicted ATPase ExeA